MLERTCDKSFMLSKPIQINSVIMRNLEEKIYKGADSWIVGECSKT